MLLYLPRIAFGKNELSALKKILFAQIRLVFAQGNVLASAPHPAGPANTDTNYSPLWQVSLVSWNSGRQARVLTSQTDITNASTAGDVTIQKTPIIVECSVIFTPGGGLLPGARITTDDDQQREPSGNRTDR